MLPLMYKNLRRVKDSLDFITTGFSIEDHPFGENLNFQDMNSKVTNQKKYINKILKIV
jgi:hypothetical protein